MSIHKEEDTTLAEAKPSLNCRKQHQYYHALRELQAALRQKQLDDPNLSQPHIFSFCAPLFVFICVFALGVLVPRHPQLKNRAADLLDNGTKSELTAALLFLATAIVGSLLVLRGTIWVVARLATSFCDMDLAEVASGRPDSDDTFELTPANLLVGGIIN
ncbi:hypothetical protein D9615_002075 [Tricholomella constricta]|uniref:Uncharacterized protein n=1 Tax=Tricholomella constricta TaxID=117010 RepID=A0A8H5HP79_9AGAR|nr:hypothetical protein D9615_002075 [Tricholomella constricta]